MRTPPSQGAIGAGTDRTRFSWLVAAAAACAPSSPSNTDAEEDKDQAGDEQALYLPHQDVDDLLHGGLCVDGCSMQGAGSESMP